MKLIDPKEYSHVAHRLRSFFLQRGYLETPVQDRLSILAACEDPSTIALFSYAGSCWPLPQTGQMWLEYELLRNPTVPGFFCISTSYRNEPDPIPGRHDLIFPMFEFETRGDVQTLLELEHDLLEYMGFGSRKEFACLKWEDAASLYSTEELTAKHEEKLWGDKGDVVFLTNFPERTSPFWNMKRNDDGTSAKVDAILFGIETIGSAERSSDPEEMRRSFHAISDGKYASLLYSHFGKRRVLDELEKFLNLKFFERCGGGIGMTRMIRAMRLAPDNIYKGSI